VAISIVPGSGRITKIVAAKSSVPTITDGVWNFVPGAGMHCEGEVKSNGSPGDDRAGWDVGWVQSRWIETNWAYYRGRDNHGSIFLQRGRPTARPRVRLAATPQVPWTIFTDPTDGKEFQHLPAVGAFPLTVEVESNDPPGENYAVEEDNGAKDQPNYLREVQLEFHFCTVLTVRDPAGVFHPSGALLLERALVIPLSRANLSTGRRRLERSGRHRRRQWGSRQEGFLRRTQRRPLRRCADQRPNQELRGPGSRLRAGRRANSGSARI
jgi:hypothetical protein